MTSRIEQMKKGGRRNPDDPHAFVQQPRDVAETGGYAGPSVACGVCGGTRGNPVHIEPIGGYKPIRDMHGPFGQ